MKVQFLGPFRTVSKDLKLVELKCNQVRIKVDNPIYSYTTGKWNMEAVLVVESSGLTVGGAK